MRKKNTTSFLRFGQPQIPKFEKDELLFLGSYTIYLVYMILSATFYYQYIASVWKPIYIICIGLLAVYELVKNGLNLKSIMTAGIIMLLFINILRVGQGVSQNAIAAVLFYMFCARSISFKKISWISMWVSGIILVFVIGSSCLGVIPNYVEEGSRHREYLGFLYALFAPSVLSNITLLWIYNKKEKITIPRVCIFALLNYILYEKTDARLCFLLTVLMLVIGLFYRKHGRFVMKRKLLCYGMVLSFILICALSFVLTIKYQPSVSWMEKLNSILGSRLSLGKESLEKIGIDAFGISGIQWIGNGLDMYGETSNETYTYVDSYYIQVAQRFGYVFLIIILVVLTIAAYRAYKQRDIFLLTIFFLLAIRFLIDDLYMYLHYNTYWLMVGILVFSRKTNMMTNSREKLNLILGKHAI